MVEIYETKASKEGFFITLKFSRDELREAHGWDYLWHLEKIQPPEGLKALLESVARKL